MPLNEALVRWTNASDERAEPVRRKATGERPELCEAQWLGLNWSERGELYL
jgi:hypothetical protein